MPVGAITAASAVGGSIAKGVIGANAASSAAAAATQAATTDNQLQQQVYQTNTANLQPFVNNGQSASAALSGLLGTGGDPTAANSAFQKYLGSTNYNFLLGQGEQGVEYANAPAFNSSATAKALNNYAQGQAGTALSGYEGLLSNQATQGITSGSALGTLGQQNANAQNANLNGAANVQGASDILAGNDISGAVGGALSGLTGAVANPNVQNALTGLFHSAGSASSFAGADANGFNAPGAAAFSGTNALSGLVGG